MVLPLICQQNDLGSQGNLLRDAMAIDELLQLLTFCLVHAE